MEEQEQKVELDELVNQTGFIKKLLQTSSKLSGISNQFPQTHLDIQFYQKQPGFEQYFQSTNQQLKKTMERLLRLGGSREQGLIDQDQVKYQVIVDIGDNLLENVDMSLDQIKNIKDDTVMDQIREDVRNTFNLNKTEAILKPQLQFYDQIDNTSTPFIPKIHYKYHSKLQLDSNLIQCQQNPNDFFKDFNEDELNEFQFQHPYKYEVEQLEVQDKFIQLEQIKRSRDFKDEDYKYVRLEEQVKQMVEELKHSEIIGVDLEHNQLRSYQGISCLLQISTEQQDYIVDVLEAEVRNSLNRLNEVFCDPKILKLLHYGVHDIEWLQRDFGVYVVNMFDSYQMTQHLKLQNHSLKYLLDRYCNISVDKKYQLADWRKRPLDKKMIEYARKDTHYLIEIYHSLKQELFDKVSQDKEQYIEQIKMILQRSQDVSLTNYKKPILKSQQYYSIVTKQKQMLSHKKYQLLKRLLKFRNKLARDYDESEQFVMSNQQMFKILVQDQTDKNGILKGIDNVSQVLKSNVERLLEQVNAEQQVKDIYQSVIKQNAMEEEQQINQTKIQRLYDGQVQSDDYIQMEIIDQFLQVRLVEGQHQNQADQQFESIEQKKQKQVDNQLLMQIQKGFMFKNETEFMVSLNPQIKQVFKFQYQQITKKDKKDKQNQPTKEQVEQNKVIEREEFIEFKDQKQKQGIIKVKDDQVMSKKQSQRAAKQKQQQIRQNKFNEDSQISIQQMKEVVNNLTKNKEEMRQIIQQNQDKQQKNVSEDPFDMLNKNQESKQKQGKKNIKKSIFGGLAKKFK